MQATRVQSELFCLSCTVPEGEKIVCKQGTSETTRKNSPVPQELRHEPANPELPVDRRPNLLPPKAVSAFLPTVHLASSTCLSPARPRPAGLRKGNQAAWPRCTLLPEAQSSACGPEGGMLSEVFAGAYYCRNGPFCKDNKLVQVSM